MKMYVVGIDRDNCVMTMKFGNVARSVRSCDDNDDDSDDGDDDEKNDDNVLLSCKQINI